MELKNEHLIFLLTLFIVYCYTLPRYSYYLPTIPIYDNDEANLVKEITKTRTYEDKEFFYLTDPSVTKAFLPYVEEDEKELTRIISNVLLNWTGLFLKYVINRPRPYQVDPSIDYLESKTGNTPALPAGHAFQAYYLSHILSEKYPSKKSLFKSLADKCNEVRIKAGIHYPSDGELSKIVVDSILAFEGRKEVMCSFSCFAYPFNDIDKY